MSGPNLQAVRDALSEASTGANTCRLLLDCMRNTHILGGSVADFQFEAMDARLRLIEAVIAPVLASMDAPIADELLGNFAAIREARRLAGGAS